MKKTKKTYYALWDLQCGRYLSTGLNSTNKKDLKESLLSYLSVDFENEKDKKDHEKLSIEDLALINEFQIEKQETKFKEEDF